MVLRGARTDGGCLQVAIGEFFDFGKKVLILVWICIMWPSKDFQNMTVNAVAQNMTFYAEFSYLKHFCTLFQVLSGVVAVVSPYCTCLNI